MKITHRMAIGLASVILTVPLGLVGFMMLRSPAPSVVLNKVTIAVPTQTNSALMIVASRQNLFHQTGVDVISQPFLLGKDALKSVLDGNADLAIVADTPFVTAYLGGSDIAIVTSISQSRRSIALVTFKDGNIQRIPDLIGKSVGLAKGTNLAYFFDALLQLNRVPYDKIRLVDMSPEKVIDAMKEGRIDAAVTMQPFLVMGTAGMGDRIKLTYGEDIYAFRFLLVGKTAYIDSHSQDIQRVLKGLIAAHEYVEDNPLATLNLLGEATKVDDATIAKYFIPEDYAVGLDQALLLSLEDQARWVMQRGFVASRSMPNLFSAIKYRDLEAVKPDAVTIAH